MPCANNNCGHRTWCQKLLRESIDPQECEEAKSIATWWAAKVAGIRDDYQENDEEIPFADEDFTPEDLEDG